MKHFIITRMAIPERDLFERYFLLFEKYYVPSIKSQTNQNFTLFIVAEKQDWERISNALNIPNLKLLDPYHVDNSKIFRLTEMYDKIVRSENPNIQTRHDCDDWMREDYVEKIQAIYNENINSYDKFLIHTQFDVLDVNTDKTKKGAVYSDKCPSMFLSLCQKNCSMSVMADNHTKFSQRVQKVFELAHGYTMRVEHADNLSKFVNIGKTKKAIVVGKGETAKYLKHDDYKDDIFVAINHGAIFMDKIDYLFANDIEGLQGIPKEKFKDIGIIAIPEHPHVNSKPNEWITYNLVKSKFPDNKFLIYNLFTWKPYNSTFPIPERANTSSGSAIGYLLKYGNIKTFELYGIGVGEGYHPDIMSILPESQKQCAEDWIKTRVDNVSASLVSVARKYNATIHFN